MRVNSNHLKTPKPLGVLPPEAGVICHFHELAVARELVYACPPLDYAPLVGDDLLVAGIDL